MAFRCNFFISKCLYINDKVVVNTYVVLCMSSSSEVRCKQHKGLVAGITKLVVMWRQWISGAVEPDLRVTAETDTPTTWSRWCCVTRITTELH